MKLVHWIGEIDELSPICKAWMSDHGDVFGMDVSLARIFSDYAEWKASRTGTIVVLLDEGAPVGFLVLFVIPSTLGAQNWALEKYWYVMPGHRKAGWRMVAEAKEWAKYMGCSHLLMAASNMASEMHDKCCRFYEAFGMKKFETSYICEVA